MPSMPLPVRILVALPVLALLAFPVLLVAIVAAWSTDQPFLCAVLVLVLAALVGVAGGVVAWAFCGLRGRRLATGAVLGASSVLACAAWTFLTQP
jgi:hypothetical protein